MRSSRPSIALVMAVCACTAVAGAIARAAPALRVGGTVRGTVSHRVAATPGARPRVTGTGMAAARQAAAPSQAATPSARLQIVLTPAAPGARTTIELSLQVRGGAGQPPPPLRSLALRLPAGMGFSTATLGEDNCAPASLISAGLAGCSANALLGYGSATTLLSLGARTVTAHAALHPLMGPPHKNTVEVLFYIQASSPVFAQLVLPALLAEDAPPYGERLQAAVPLVEAWPEGPDLALQSISSTIGPLNLLYHRRVGSRIVSFRPQGIRIPRTCPPGGYPFAAVLSFADGASTTSSYRVACAR